MITYMESKSAKLVARRERSKLVDILFFFFFFFFGKKEEKKKKRATLSRKSVALLKNFGITWKLIVSIFVR